MQADPWHLEGIVSAIVKAADPLRIILFGSAARGEMTAGSDVDLLVVMPDGSHRRKTAQLLYRSIRGAGLPFDLVVATAEDLTKFADNPSLIYGTALSEGRTLYVRAA